MLQNTSDRHSALQQNADENFAQSLITIHVLLLMKLFSNTRSTQDYIIAPKIDTRITTDALFEIDDQSNSRDDSNFKQDTKSTASMDLNIPVDQKNEKTTLQQMKFSHVVVKKPKT